MPKRSCWFKFYPPAPEQRHEQSSESKSSKHLSIDPYFIVELAGQQEKGVFAGERRLALFSSG